jgi:hypothetical protein
MDVRTKRSLLFLFGCMGTRLSLVWAAYKFPEFLSTLGFIALIPAVGFMYIYVNGLRKTGPEVFGERIWWNHLRPLHSVLWFTFAYMAINNMYQDAWKVLLLDVSIGFTAWLTSPQRASSQLASSPRASPQ